MGGYADFVAELFEGLGPLRIKRMFGGLGVWADEVMFALVDQDVIYIKVDDALREDLRAEGSIAWTYSRRDGWIQETSYWRLPETALDDPEEAVAWARRALAAARANAAAKPKRAKRKTA